jgi:hypothetical protein
MPWITATPVHIWAVLFIPLSLWLLLKIPKTRLMTFMLFLDYVAFNLFWLLTVNWGYVNYYLRFVAPLVGLIILVRFLTHHIGYQTPFFPKSRSGWVGFAAAVVFLVGAAWIDSFAITGARYTSVKDKAVLGLLPLRSGMYVIANGGDGIDGRFMNNYLNDWLGRETGADPSLAYALDFIGLYQDTGRPSEKANPKIAPDYKIHNEPIYAPCVGEIVAVEDGHPEVAPLAPGWEMGNYVVLKCADYYVTLANLRAGTIIVKPGDQVSTNMMLGNVGNSGDRTIPHLHMHVTYGGWAPGSTPVPAMFDTTTYEFAMRARNHLFIR